MSTCIWCPPRPKLAVVVKRNELPKPLRRLIGTVQSARVAEWSALHAYHGGYSGGRTRAKGSDGAHAATIAHGANVEWVRAVVLLLNWSRT